MPRTPKPFFRTQTQNWYCSSGGKQVCLGKTKAEAFQKFHELMARGRETAHETATFYQLSQAYLDWCEKHRKAGTYKLQRHYLKSFVESIGRRLAASKIKKHHLTSWLETQSWGTTTQNDAIGAVVRVFNWAIEEGHISASPIPKVRKPPRRRREVFYTPAQWEQILSHAKGPLNDFLRFLWLTGCRPQEGRFLETRHVHDDLLIFPASEAKGQKHDRVIFLTPEAKELIDPLTLKYPSGPLFRNGKGKPWNKNSLKCRLTRISSKVGFRVISYGVRHAFATNALLNGVDPVSVSHLMGHRSPAMVTTVYSHLAENHAFLRQQAKNAVRSPSVSEAAE